MNTRPGIVTAGWQREVEEWLRVQWGWNKEKLDVAGAFCAQQPSVEGGGQQKLTNQAAVGPDDGQSRVCPVGSQGKTEDQGLGRGQLEKQWI